LSNNCLLELPKPPTGKTGWPWTDAPETLPVLMPDGSAWPKISVVTPSYNQGQFITKHSVDRLMMREISTKNL